MTQIKTVSTKGQFVIPSEMRKQLGIEPGTRIAVGPQAEDCRPSLVRRSINDSKEETWEQSMRRAGRKMRGE